MKLQLRITVWFLFLFSLLPVKFLVAESPLIDSLRGVIGVYERTNGHYNELVNLYNRIALEYTFSDPNEAELCLKRAMSYAFKDNTPQSYSAVYYNYGKYYNLRGIYSLALENFFKSYEHNIQYNAPSAVGYILIDIGNVFFAMENYVAAYRFYTRAINNFEHDEKFNGSSVAMNNIGLIKLKLQENDSALFYFRKVLEMRKSRNQYPIPVGLNYYYVGKAYLQMDRLEEAMNYFNLALTTMSGADSSVMEVGNIQGDIQRDLGELYNRTGEHDLADYAYQTAIQWYSRVGNKLGITEVYRSIAEHYFNLQEYASARIWADSLYALSSKINHIELLSEACHLHSLLCIKNNDPVNAQRYLSEYYSLQGKVKAILRDNTGRQIDVAMETLTREREDELKRAKEKEFTFYLLIATGVIAVIAVFILKLFISKRKQELRFRQLSNSTFEGLFIHDKNKILDFNLKILSILKVSAKEFKSMKLHDFIPADYLDIFNRNLLSAEEKQEEIELLTKTGERLPVELLTRFFDESKGYRIVAVREISAERSTRFALMESERKLETLLGNLPGMAYRCKNDKNWTMEFVSKGCFKLTGYSSEDLIDNKTTSYNDLISPEYRDYLWRKWQQVLENRTTFEDEYSIITATGELRWVWESGNGIFSENGELLALEGFIMDISEQKSAITDIIKSEKILKESNATKDKFFSIIAHDLKGPLHALQGFSELLKEGYTEYSDEDRIRYIRNIHEVAEQLNKLLQNLLDWSRSKTGRIDFHPENKYLSLIVKTTSDLLFEQARAKNITIVSKVTADIRVFCDENMIQTVIRNLISNAIKFTFPGGRIFIESDTHGPEILVSIADNGIGIPKSQINKLFRIDEVYKTDGTQKEKGTGLGLILCKEFVEKNGGRIWAESEPGKGSRFYFTLPKSR